jgi:hypothetical protein
MKTRVPPTDGRMSASLKKKKNRNRLFHRKASTNCTNACATSPSILPPERSSAQQFVRSCSHHAERVSVYFAARQCHDWLRNIEVVTWITVRRWCAIRAYEAALSLVFGIPGAPVFQTRPIGLSGVATVVSGSSECRPTIHGRKSLLRCASTIHSFGHCHRLVHC